MSEVVVPESHDNELLLPGPGEDGNLRKCVYKQNEISRALLCLGPSGSSGR